MPKSPDRRRALRAGVKFLLLISGGALFVLDPGLFTFAWAPIIPGGLILLADD